MAPVVPNPRLIKSFPTAAAFERWMAAHHDDEPEIWLRVYKKDSGVASVTVAEALDVALCWGWIDAIRKTYDAESYLQRYTPRKARSMWSQINRDNVARLIAAGRMTPHGQRQIDAAQADGRWEAAYAPMRGATAEDLPADLLAAIKANPRARKTFATLSRPNLFSLRFRVGNMKTPEGRARKIATLVDMLARGETIIPQKAPSARKATTSKK
jgi:uncharacterized protein YdeI (YjbR/CyaY-like superfamily)